MKYLSMSGVLGPAPDKDRDVSVVAKAADWLGVYFFLCARCCAEDAAG
jgi:hypothetical protein